MRKITFFIILSIITILVGIIILLSTTGFKTNNFNNMINEKVNEINPKINLELNDLKFKLNPSNFTLSVVTTDSKISIKDKKIDLESIKFDLIIIDYFNKKNPISQISISSKENKINQFTDFINEYDFNLARNLILKQIKKGKVKINSELVFDKNNPNKFNYFINGYVNDAEIELKKEATLKNINLKFQTGEDFINLSQMELIFDKIFITSQNINIKKNSEKYELNGDLKTEKSKINLNSLRKIINFKFDILDEKPLDLSSDSKFSLEINKFFRINNLKFETKLNFDKLYSKSKYQELIHLKNGDILINYNKEEIKINLDSEFLFNKDEYNNNKSINSITSVYSKKQNNDASIDMIVTSSKNKINSKEFKKYFSLKNFSLVDQEILFSSNNNIKFNINKNNQVKNLNIKSKVKTEDILINYKSQRIRKYFKNFKNQVKLSKSDLNLEYTSNKFKINLKSKYSINDINENISLSVNKNNNNYSFDLGLNLDSAEIQISELNYKKNANIKSDLQVNGIYKNNNEILFNNIKFKEEENSLLIQNLQIDKNDKIKNLDLFKINLINKMGKKNDLEFKKVKDNYYLSGNEYDGTKNIKNFLDSSSKSFFNNFKNLNTTIFLDIKQYYVNNKSYLSNLNGELQIKNNEIFNSNIIAKLNDKRKFKLKIETNNYKQKITSLEIDRPEPFIENFKFIKGFKEGNLIYESTEFEGKTKSNLKIIDFKVQEVPVLAKLLTLASLQGIADLLTGEGIRFTDFEMDYEKLGNTTNIKEMYAIGPAISLIMEGYIIKNELTSLRGTLVPATTINKTISKIPMLGEILVGKKVGEGVFGVSFKIKGPPKKLKTSVNPIKTLTPRFITRTLEKISN